MQSGKFNARSLWPLAVLGLFAIFGYLLFRYAYPNAPFSEEQLIYDLIWLDAWALSFVAVLVVAWFSRLARWLKAWMFVAACAVWGGVTIALFFHGTPFGLNAFGGDQAFRIAMILKFKTFIGWVDYYYKDLPAFYPPLYYWLLAMLSKIISANAYLMIKVGSILVYLLSPVGLYLIWRRLVTPLQAAVISVVAILFVSFGKAFPLVAPHAFLANSFFIPWWFHYVEQVRVSKTGWKFYVAGGIIGGLLFMTYYFPFFIGALLLMVRLLAVKKGYLFAARLTAFRWSRALAVLGLAAIVSSPYWLPLLWSFITIGYDPAQQEWHHIGSTGIAFEYLHFTLPGIVYLACLLYAIRRRRTPIYRGFLLLTGTVILFHLVGSILGGLDHPVNVIKAGEFIALAGGPLVGLVFATMLRRTSSRRKRTYIPAAIVLAVVMFMLHQVDGYAKHDMVRTARTVDIPTWGLDAPAMANRTGSVFLTRNEKLFTFYPVYTFFAINQHYSHPAARLSDRLDLLDQLQGVADPYIFNLALRENIYDEIDYFMPTLVDGRWELIAALSNYPNKYRHVYFRYDTLLTADTRLFRRLEGDYLYEVIKPRPHAAPISLAEDQLTLARRIAIHLTDEGRRELSAYLGIEL